MVINLTEEKKGQIALAFLRQATAGAESTPPMSELGAVELVEDIKKMYREIPVEFDISFVEALSFFRELVRDQDKDIFDKVTYKYVGPAIVPS